MKDNPNYYQFLKVTRPLAETKASKQIDKDLDRTFPYDKSFSRLQLKEILLAYSYRNPNIGYCQGLNFVVALLLSFGFSEEEAFWMYVQIIEKYLPLEYFTSMRGVILDQKVFDYLFRIKLQKMCKHMEKVGVDTCLFTVQWFICMFGFTFKKDIVRHLWDIIFIHGTNSLYQIGLATLWIIKKDIMNKTEFIQLLGAIDKGCKNIYDIEVFTKALLKRNFRIKSILIKKLKSILEKEVNNEFIDRFPELNEPKRFLKSVGIMCQNEEECKQKVFVTDSFLTLSCCEIQVVEGFLDTHPYPVIFDAGNLCRIEENHLVGKKNHLCHFETEPEDVFENDDSDIEEICFLKRLPTTSVKKSFMQISSFLCSEDLE